MPIDSKTIEELNIKHENNQKKINELIHEITIIKNLLTKTKDLKLFDFDEFSDKTYPSNEELKNKVEKNLKPLKRIIKNPNPTYIRKWLLTPINPALAQFPFDVSTDLQKSVFKKNEAPENLSYEKSQQLMKEVLSSTPIKTLHIPNTEIQKYSRNTNLLDQQLETTKKLIEEEETKLINHLVSEWSHYSTKIKSLKNSLADNNNFESLEQSAKNLENIINDWQNNYATNEICSKNLQFIQPQAIAILTSFKFEVKKEKPMELIANKKEEINTIITSEKNPRALITNLEKPIQELSDTKQHIISNIIYYEALKKNFKETSKLISAEIEKNNTLDGTIKENELTLSKLKDYYNQMDIIEPTLSDISESAESIKSIQMTNIKDSLSLLRSATLSKQSYIKKLEDEIEHIKDILQKAREESWEKLEEKYKKINNSFIDIKLESLNRIQSTVKDLSENNKLYPKEIATTDLIDKSKEDQKFIQNLEFTSLERFETYDKIEKLDFKTYIENFQTKLNIIKSNQENLNKITNIEFYYKDIAKTKAIKLENINTIKTHHIANIQNKKKMYKDNSDMILKNITTKYAESLANFDKLVSKNIYDKIEKVLNIDPNSTFTNSVIIPNNIGKFNQPPYEKIDLNDANNLEHYSELIRTKFDTFKNTQKTAPSSLSHQKKIVSAFTGGLTAYLLSGNKAVNESTAINFISGIIPGGSFLKSYAAPLCGGALAALVTNHLISEIGLGAEEAAQFKNDLKNKGFDDKEYETLSRDISSLFWYRDILNAELLEYNKSSLLKEGSHLHALLKEVGGLTTKELKILIDKSFMEALDSALNTWFSKIQEIQNSLIEAHKEASWASKWWTYLTEKKEKNEQFTIGLRLGLLESCIAFFNEEKDKKYLFAYPLRAASIIGIVTCLVSTTLYKLMAVYGIPGGFPTIIFNFLAGGVAAPFTTILSLSVAVTIVSYIILKVLNRANFFQPYLYKRTSLDKSIIEVFCTYLRNMKTNLEEVYNEIIATSNLNAVKELDKFKAKSNSIFNLFSRESQKVSHPLGDNIEWAKYFLRQYRDSVYHDGVLKNVIGDLMDQAAKQTLDMQEALSYLLKHPSAPEGKPLLKFLDEINPYLENNKAFVKQYDLKTKFKKQILQILSDVPPELYFAIPEKLKAIYTGTLGGQLEDLRIVVEQLNKKGDQKTNWQNITQSMLQKLNTFPENKWVLRGENNYRGLFNMRADSQGELNELNKEFADNCSEYLNHSYLFLTSLLKTDQTKELDGTVEKLDKPFIVTEEFLLYKALLVRQLADLWSANMNSTSKQIQIVRFAKSKLGIVDPKALFLNIQNDLERDSSDEKIRDILYNIMSHTSTRIETPRTLIEREIDTKVYKDNTTIGFKNYKKEMIIDGLDLTKHLDRIKANKMRIDQFIEKALEKSVLLTSNTLNIYFETVLEQVKWDKNFILQNYPKALKDSLQVYQDIETTVKEAKLKQENLKSNIKPKELENPQEAEFEEGQQPKVG